ncbi:hypothetical protein BaRGS_00037068, partial [Batillaria attramentaria]
MRGRPDIRVAFRPVPASIRHFAGNFLFLETSSKQQLSESDQKNEGAERGSLGRRRQCG